jgi:hypothetical protein
MQIVLKIFKQITKFLFIIIIVSGLGYLLVNYYSVIFSKHVSGVVIGVERVEMPVAVITQGSQNPSSQVFSFAVAIKDEKTKEIFTASSEDRQWAVVTKGQCAEAEFLPYPPWNLAKKGTYFGARLIKLTECDR